MTTSAPLYNPTMPEGDFIGRNGKPYTSTMVSSDSVSIPSSMIDQASGSVSSSTRVSSDSASVPSSMITQAIGSVPTEYIEDQDRDGPSLGKHKKTVGIFVPAGLEPGRKVKVRYSKGTMLRKIPIPPRSEWMSKNCNGAPRPFFLVNSSVTSIFERPAKSSKNVHFPNSIDTVCLVCQGCSPSLGIYDPMCPFHGTGPMRCC